MLEKANRRRKLMTSHDYSLDKSYAPCSTDSVSMKHKAKCLYPALFQSFIAANRLSILCRTGLPYAHMGREHERQVCSSGSLFLRGRGNRTDAPHSQHNSTSFNSFRSIVVTCLGVIAPHFFFGFAAADTLNCCLISRLIEASNFRVGTLCNISRFVFASMVTYDPS